MRFKNLIIILVILILGKVLIDRIFKIRYSIKNTFEITNFQVNDSIFIEKGSIVVGKNVKGYLEASIFPNNLKLSDNSTIEYVYFRFNNDWYNKNIIPHLSKLNVKNINELYLYGKALHKTNFSNYMHFNDYPLVREDYFPVVLKVKETGEKIRFLSDKRE